MGLRERLRPDDAVPPSVRHAATIVRENPRRAVHVLLWLLTGFALGFGISGAAWFLGAVIRLVGGGR